jgi:hypothetical protein
MEPKSHHVLVTNDLLAGCDAITKKKIAYYTNEIGRDNISMNLILKVYI